MHTSAASSLASVLNSSFVVNRNSQSSPSPQTGSQAASHVLDDLSYGVSYEESGDETDVSCDCASRSSSTRAASSCARSVRSISL